MADDHFSLRHRLRHLIEPEHAALERDVGFDGLNTVGGYARFLRMNLDAYAQLQHWLVDGIVADRNHVLAGKTALMSDLRALGTAATPNALHLEAPAQPLGVMYVVAGSRLGNAVIRKKLRDAPFAAKASGFLHLDGTEALWRSVQGRLEAAPTEDADAIAASASATFACFHQALKAEDQRVRQRI